MLAAWNYIPISNAIHYIYLLYKLFYAGWMAWLPVASSTRESTDNFQKMQTIKQYN